MTDNSFLKAAIASLENQLAEARRLLSEKERPSYAGAFDKTLEWAASRPGALIAWVGPWELQERDNWDFFLQDADKFFSEIPGIAIIRSPDVTLVQLPDVDASIYIMRNSYNLRTIQGKRFDYYLAWEEEMSPKESADVLGTILGRARGGALIR